MSAYAYHSKAKLSPVASHGYRALGMASVLWHYLHSIIDELFYGPFCTTADEFSYRLRRKRQICGERSATRKPKAKPNTKKAKAGIGGYLKQVIRQRTKVDPSKKLSIHCSRAKGQALT